MVARAWGTGTRTAKGWLGIDDPILTVQAAQQLRELLGISEGGGRTGTMKFLAAVQAFQSARNFPRPIWKTSSRIRPAMYMP